MIKIKKNKTYIIAEIGINHDGKFPLARKLILEAKKNGADAVKFQIFNYKTLAGYTNKKSLDQKKNLKWKNLNNFWKRMQLSPTVIKKLYKLVKMNGLDFICSVFDLESLKILKKVKVDAYKIASSDLTDHFLISQIKKLNKPMILSTGMATKKEISRCLKYVDKKKIFLMHCVSMYPCEKRDVNLNRMITLKKNFRLPVGYSDHSIGNEACIRAIELGANLVEKHFTINNKKNYGDHQLSANPEDLRFICSYNKQREILLGNKIIQPSKRERSLCNLYRKGIYAKRDLKKNNVLKIQDIKFIRNQIGLKSEDYYKIIGKKIRKKILKNEPLKANYFF